MPKLNYNYNNTPQSSSPRKSNNAPTLKATNLQQYKTYIINGQRGKFDHYNSATGRVYFKKNDNTEFSTSQPNGYSLANSRKSRKNRKQSRKQSRKNNHK